MLRLKMKKILITSLLFINLYSLEIINKPIIFTQDRVNMTKNYIKNHYFLNVDNIKIIPRLIVVHHTGINSFEKSFNRFYNEKLPDDRPDIKKASSLNVSAHYMIDKKGKIYKLMPDNIMARHVIGLNYNSIGIENVGGENFENNLTKNQLNANVKLIKYLKNRYKTIKKVIGHYEYRDYERSALWLEKDNSYRTIKNDPSRIFMSKLLKRLKN